MCTAVTYQTKDHYFGRNLDLEYIYDEHVVITPRQYPLSFRCEEPQHTHLAMIGMATVAQGYPLYYEATNECGISGAGLNFPDNAHYLPVDESKRNIAPFELIPWVLGQCKSVADVRRLLMGANIAKVQFNQEFPLTPLHWIFSDKSGSVTVEPGQSGLKIYDNPVGILTNNPPFDYHMHNLCNYMNLTCEEARNRFCKDFDIKAYSRGMGAFGLPGDLSSASRFVKAAFTKLNSVSGNTEEESISQFFHILNAVAQQRGCVRIGDAFEITAYSSCCNTDKGIFYYTTYENSQITAVRLHSVELDKEELYVFPLVKEQQIRFVN